jgi:glycosyltransferase involved in cell wall biosynthesis
MAKLKIALFIPTLDGGGAERVMLLLAEEFLVRGYQADLLLANAVGPYLKQIPSKIRLIDLNSKKPLTAIPALINYIRKERPYAVLSSLFHANLALLWAIKLARISVRCVVREANTISFDLSVSKNISTPMISWLIRRCYPWADAIVSLSHGVADDLSITTGLPRDNIKVIYNPVDVQSIQKKAKEETDHPWFNENKPPVIIGIGRFCEQKDFLTLIRSFSIVIQQKDARLIILGDGDMRPQLELLIQDLKLTDKIDLPGFRDNPYSFLARSAVFVLSSKWEGLGNVLIEALACNVPIVATNCKCGPGEVLQQGKYGKLVPIGNPKALADKILEVIDGNFPKFNKNEALARFKKDIIAEKFINLLITKR